MDSLKILLNKALSKKSVETKKTLNVELKGNKKLLPEGMINGYVNSYELYNDERRNCNKIRLICKINSLCSNVLFNPKTEIWRYENDGTPIVLFVYICSQSIAERDPIQLVVIGWHDNPAIMLGKIKPLFERAHNHATSISAIIIASKLIWR